MTKTMWLAGSAVKVRLVTDKTMPDDWGDYRPDTDTIRINRSQSVDVRLHQLVHEAMHAIFERLALVDELKGPKRLEAEERLVRALAPAIVGMMRDNGVDLSPLYKLVRK